MVAGRTTNWRQRAGTGPWFYVCLLFLLSEYFHSVWVKLIKPFWLKVELKVISLELKMIFFWTFSIIFIKKCPAAAHKHLGERWGQPVTLWLQPPAQQSAPPASCCTPARNPAPSPCCYSPKKQRAPPRSADSARGRRAAWPPGRTPPHPRLWSKKKASKQERSWGSARFVFFIPIKSTLETAHRTSSSFRDNSTRCTAVARSFSCTTKVGDWNMSSTLHASTHSPATLNRFPTE